MASAINFSKTQRIVLLIDLNPLLKSPNPNPSYIISILTTSNIILSFNSISSSLFSFKFFFSSLSPLRSATVLRRILPNHPLSSLSFNLRSETLISLTETLNSISLTEFTCSNSIFTHTAGSLMQLACDYDWEAEIEIERISGKFNSEFAGIRSNLIVLLSPVCRSVNELAEFMCFDVNDDCVRNLDVFLASFRDCFSAVSDVFNSKDIHLCWIDIRIIEEVEVNESKDDFVLIGNEIRKFGWGYCGTDSIILGSALVSFGLIYPNIVVSCKLLDDCRLDKKIRGQLSLEITDVSGKPLECKLCDLELMRLKILSKIKTRKVGRLKGEGVDSVNSFLGSLNDGIVKMRVTAVRRFTKLENFEELSPDYFLVRSYESGKKGKDGLDNVFANRVLELLAGEKSELFDKCTVPTWQIFLSFLYREGYWALLLLSNSNGDSYSGILKPFTIHSAIMLFLDNNHFLTKKFGGFNLLTNENVSQGDIVSQKVASLSGKYVHVGDGKRRKMRKHTHRDLTWSSFCKAAYEFLDVDLAEVYFANGLKKSKKLKFLKCWMNQVKNQSLLSHENMPHGCQKVPDSNQQKETDINENSAANYQESNERLSTHTCSDQSRMQEDTALVSCSETSETFFSNLPMKIQHGLESDGVDLKIFAGRLVNLSIYWLRKKHETNENVTEIMKLLLREPKDLLEHKDNHPSSTSEYIFREYELQIFLRLEILQSEYAESMKESMKVKLVKQICSLLEIIQFLVEGGVYGGVSIYAYVERNIKARYSQNLGEVVDNIYDQLDLLPCGEEDEDQANVFNSEDSNQSWREKPMIQDSLSVDDESFHSLEKVNKSHELPTKDYIEEKLNEAQERRENARRFRSFTSSRMPDLQRVWAPKQSKTTKVKPEPSKRKKQRKSNYSVVCETPLAGNQPSSSTRRNKGERNNGCNSVSKALFQDEDY